MALGLANAIATHPIAVSGGVAVVVIESDGVIDSRLPVERAHLLLPQKKGAILLSTRAHSRLPEMVMPRLPADKPDGVA